MSDQSLSIITELRNNIQERDLIKARFVLGYLEELDWSAQQEAVKAVFESPDDFALPLLFLLAEKYPAILNKMTRIRQGLLERVRANPQALTALLESTGNPRIRVMVINLAVEASLTEASPMIRHILISESDESVLEAAIAASGHLADEKAVPDLSDYLYAENPELISAALEALGRIGSPEAIRRLSGKLGGNLVLDLRIIHYFSKADNDEGFRALCSVLAADRAYLRVAAKKKLFDAGDRSLPFLQENLELDNPDLLIHTLNVLGDIGDAAAIGPVRSLINRQPDDANVRFAAYEALGQFALGGKAYVLAPGLADPVENVRSAAAMAIDRNFNAALAKGVRNMIEPGNEESAAIAATIIDAQCDNIFAVMIGVDFFRSVALNHLARQAHPDVRKHYLEFMSGRGYSELAEEIIARVTEETSERTRVMAVDDSKAILRIIKGMLHKLGYEPHVFEFPAEALEEIDRIRPAFLFTDLNMPNITGVELTRRVRQKFGPDQLPIIMVTTQQDQADADAALAAGVTHIIHKPFTEQDLVQAISRVKPD